jgi:hypothetical protein
VGSLDTITRSGLSASVDSGRCRFGAAPFVVFDDTTSQG